MATEKTSALGAELEAVMAQLASLREEMTKLAASASAAAGDRSETLGKDIADGLAEAKRYVGGKGHDAEARLEGAVKSNPLLALGVAAGLGLLLGALMRR